MFSRVSLAVHCLSQSSQAWPIWRLPAVFHSFVEGLVLHSHLDHKDEVSLVLWCYKCSFHCGLKTTAEPGAGTPRLIAWKICSTWFTTDWRRRSFTTEELLGSLSAHLLCLLQHRVENEVNVSGGSVGVRSIDGLLKSIPTLPFEVQKLVKLDAVYQVLEQLTPVWGMQHLSERNREVSCV